MSNLSEKSFTTNGLAYIVQAETKIMDFEKLKKLNLFDRKNTIAKSIYYTKGTFHKKNIKVDFLKAYFYEGDFYMQGCFSTDINSSIKAKTALYKGDYIEFKDLVLKKDGKIYHKFKYRVDTQ